MHAMDSGYLPRLFKARDKVDKICQVSGVAGASIGVIHHGAIVHTYNYGYSDMDAKTSTSNNTVYGIGSVTKSFISAALARLVHEKLLTWDTLVKDVLLEFKHDNPAITDMLTVTDILTHRCGLSGSGAMNLAFQGDGDMLLPKDSMFELINHFPILFPFRQNWRYFVWGYSLAGAIIEKITKKPLKEYLLQTIFQPLGMNETSFRPNLFDPEKLASPYAALSDGTPTRLKKLQLFENTFFEASGGIYSSLDDLMIWALATLQSIGSARDSNPSHESALKEIPYIMSNHAAISNPSITERSYGLGWVRTQLPGAVGLIGDNAELWTAQEMPALGSKDQPCFMLYHQGSTIGYYTFLALFPDTDSAVVVLTNSIALSDAADWISRTMIQALFNFNEDHDYVELTKEANERVLDQFQHLTKEIEKMRMPWPVLQGIRVGDFVGKYANSSGLFSIHIYTAKYSNDLLLFSFQGLGDQTYELRHLCEHVFEWSLTHDESKRRGRYNTPVLEYYLFRFQIDDDGHIVSFTWANNTSLVNVAEVFYKLT